MLLTEYVHKPKNKWWENISYKHSENYNVMYLKYSCNLHDALHLLLSYYFTARAANMSPTAMHVSLDACTIIGIFSAIKATAEVRINSYTSSLFIFGRRALGLYA